MRNLEIANEVMAIMQADSRLEVHSLSNPKLRVVTKYGSSPARLCSNRHSLGGRYGNLGFGGTQARAVGQLVRWLRYLPRHPLLAWSYWSSMGLGNDEMVATLEETDYSYKTNCVLCGKVNPTDWWCLNNVSGPCCHFGRCNA